MDDITKKFYDTINSGKPKENIKSEKKMPDKSQTVDTSKPSVSNGQVNMPRTPTASDDVKGMVTQTINDIPAEVKPTDTPVNTLVQQSESKTEVQTNNPTDETSNDFVEELNRKKRQAKEAFKQDRRLLGKSERYATIKEMPPVLLDFVKSYLFGKRSNDMSTLSHNQNYLVGYLIYQLIKFSGASIDDAGYIIYPSVDTGRVIRSDSAIPEKELDMYKKYDLVYGDDWSLEHIFKRLSGDKLTQLENMNEKLMNGMMNIIKSNKLSQIMLERIIYSQFGYGSSGSETDLSNIFGDKFETYSRKFEGELSKVYKNRQNSAGANRSYLE